MIHPFNGYSELFVPAERLNLKHMMTLFHWLILILILAMIQNLCAWSCASGASWIWELVILLMDLKWGALEISNARVAKESLCYSDRTFKFHKLSNSYSPMDLAIGSTLLGSTMEKRWHKTAVGLVRFNAPLHLQPKLREWMTDVNSVYEWVGILIRRKPKPIWLRNGSYNRSRFVDA